MFIIVILYILLSALFYVVFKYFSSYNNIYLFQSHAEKKNSTSFVMVLRIYNEKCIGFNGNCNGACWSLLVIGRKKTTTKS